MARPTAGRYECRPDVHDHGHGGRPSAGGNQRLRRRRPGQRPESLTSWQTISILTGPADDHRMCLTALSLRPCVRRPWARHRGRPQSLTYDPTGLLTGIDQFQYELSDGRGDVISARPVSDRKRHLRAGATAPKIVALSRPPARRSRSSSSGAAPTSRLWGEVLPAPGEPQRGHVRLGDRARGSHHRITDGDQREHLYLSCPGVDKVGNVGAWVVSAPFVPSNVPRPAPPTRSHSTGSLVPAAMRGSNSPLRVTRRSVTVFGIQP